MPLDRANRIEKWRYLFMVVKNTEDLQKKIDQYCKAGEYDTARRFVDKYGPEIEGFNIDQAYFDILKLEKKKPQIEKK